MVGQGSFPPVDESVQDRPPDAARPHAGRRRLESGRVELGGVHRARPARPAAQQGLTLLEANVDNTPRWPRPCNSLIARGAQAIWIGGDNTVMSAIGSRHRHRPRGAHSGVHDLARHARSRHAVRRRPRLLRGRPARRPARRADPEGRRSEATIPIRDVLDVVPPDVVVNTTALAGLKEPWRLPDDLLAQATVTVDADGRRTAIATGVGGRSERRGASDLIEFNQVVDVEEAEDGVLDGFKEAGLVEGRDYRMTVRNAQGDMATVSGLIDAALSERRRSAHHVLDADAAGGAAARHAACRSSSTTWPSRSPPAPARSDTDHLPNVTGVYMLAAYDEMLAMIRRILPAVSRRHGLRAGGSELGLQPRSAGGRLPESRADARDRAGELQRPRWPTPASRWPRGARTRSARCPAT